MKTLIIVSSTYLGNTMKVAKAMAQELKATVKCPKEVTESDISSYDLIGLGSGINFASHNKEIISLVEELDIARKRYSSFQPDAGPY